MAQIDPALMKIFGFWSGVLVLKLLAMPLLTARQRFRKMIFANPEDVSMKKAKVAFDDPDIERVRRSHLNDLENILPWFIVTYMWLTTGPSVWLAGMLIRAFVFSRIAHTLVYAIFPMQPGRAIAFFVGYGITAYQTVSTILHFL